MRCNGPREFRRARKAEETVAGAPAPVAPAAPPPALRKDPNVPRRTRWQHELDWQRARMAAAAAAAARRARANTPSATEAAARKRAAKEAAKLRARAAAGLPRPQPRTPAEATGGEKLGLSLNQRRYFSARAMQALVQKFGPMPHTLQVRS